MCVKASKVKNRDRFSAVAIIVNIRYCLSKIYTSIVCLHSPELSFSLQSLISYIDGKISNSQDTENLKQSANYKENHPIALNLVITNYSL